MFIEIKNDKKCSQCGSINFHEYVTRLDEQLIRCRSCGHQKVIARLTTSSTERVSYQSQNIPPTEIF
jgi:uncharacterized Zn finger protein